MIKYAVEELKVDGGFINDYQDITKGFIVSKCYVIEDIIRHPFENPIQMYLVSFPYYNFEDFSIYLDRNINYKYYYEENGVNKPNSLRRVSTIFDTYEEAKEKANIENEMLKDTLTADANCLGFWKELKEIEDNFYDTMKKCEKYEDWILENTKDMEISNVELGRCKKKVNN